LRQDERVMQFFSLVNSLLLNDPETFRRNLAIQRFAVIPLSTNSGLIGWVPHSDTLHALIKDYREKKKILLNIEHRIMQRMTPDYDHLPLMNKVEVFEHSLEHTQGDDLAKLLLSSLHLQKCGLKDELTLQGHLPLCPWLDTFLV